MGAASAMKTEQERADRKRKKKERKGKDTLTIDSDVGIERGSPSKESAKKKVLSEKRKRSKALEVVLADAESPLASSKKKRKKTMPEGTERQKKGPAEERLLSNGSSQDQDQESAKPTERVKERKRKAGPGDASVSLDPSLKKKKRKKGSEGGAEEKLPSRKKSKKVKDTLKLEANEPSLQDLDQERQAADEGEQKGSRGTGAPSKKKKRRKSENVDLDAPAPGTAGPSNVVKEPESHQIVFSKERAESWKNDQERTDLKYGRFTKEEDEILRAAIADYIEGRNLGDDAIEKLLSTRKHKEVLGAWLDIGRCLPSRSIKRVHARATRLLHEGNYKGKWSTEEEERLRALYAQSGPKWARIGVLLGRLPDACKDKWRLLKVANKRKGAWSQKERDTLFRLVQENFRQKADENIVVDGRIVKDNINWTAISEKMGGRDYSQCLLQWYQVLAPDRVWTRMESVEWSHEDDQLMLQRIMESGAASEPDVEWNDLLPGKDGSLCRKRWRMMVKHSAPLQDFEGKLRQLCERYAPSLLSGA